VVADALSVSTVANTTDNETVVDSINQADRHVFVQSAGRIVALSGGIFVGVINVTILHGVQALSLPQKLEHYDKVLHVGLLIPLLGVMAIIADLLTTRGTADNRPPTPVDWRLLASSVLYVIIVGFIGVWGGENREILVLIVSGLIITAMGIRILPKIDSTKRASFLALLGMVFVFQAVPDVGPGAMWWEIDVLHFDQSFFAVVSITSSVSAIVGIGIISAIFSRIRIGSIYTILTILIFLLSLPYIAMYYGWHQSLVEATHGIISAQTISLVDNIVGAPLGMAIMLPALIQTATQAPREIQSTFMALSTSFMNFAWACGTVATKALNEVFPVAREIKDATSGLTLLPADYSHLGTLFITVTVIQLIVPLVAIGVIKAKRIPDW
jgi:hypothetical protein